LRSRLLTIAAALPLFAMSLVLPSVVGSGASANVQSAPVAHGIRGVTRTITAGRVVVFPRPNTGTVGRPSSPEINPAELAEGDPADGAASKAGSKALTKAHGGFTYNRRLPHTASGTSRSTPLSAVRDSGVVRTGPQLKGSFDGIDHFDSRTADGGNQFSGEPPDQGLCVGNGKVFESVNSAVRVYNKNGTAHGVTSLNRFYGLASSFVRPSGPFGPDVFDPSCVFDPQTKTFSRWPTTLASIRRPVL